MMAIMTRGRFLKGVITLFQAIPGINVPGIRSFIPGIEEPGPDKQVNFPLC